jgi:hypothetical protein
MLKTFRCKTCDTVGASLLFIASLFPAVLKAQDPIEVAAVDIGVTAGNLVFLPAKALSVSVGLLSGALSYLVTGGNAELSRQIWRDTTQGPYVITPEVVYKAIGRRPELLEEK